MKQFFFISALLLSFNCFSQEKCDLAYNLADDVQEYCNTILTENTKGKVLKKLANDLAKKVKNGKKESVSCNCVEGFKAFKVAFGYSKLAKKKAKKKPEESREAVKEIQKAIAGAVLKIEECGVTEVRLKNKKYKNVVE